MRSRQSLTLAGSLAACAFAASPSQASDPYPAFIVGKVVDITSTTAGLMVRMDDNRVPTLCGTPSVGWMLVPQSSSAMISVFLTEWAASKKNFTIYIDSAVGTSCIVNQINPIES
ncbi:hypothetical protein RZN05_14960 [Sphingomonas sp. HF-S4]|uniref:Uncharacterized protein n=1 Tax=Sphingomonas agrestis TaxID=3080540 RepID=A0ABU3YA77_9SPHN|nr:hypothetical protein [Sphingomonas sp. HF-S4]MDV3458295.1 hypothetical protein [Sphingomonas sp. HF-S4]